MISVIQNAANLPLDQQSQGTVPDVSGALQNYYQPLVFTLVSKSEASFQVVEVGMNINMAGVMQPFEPQDLKLLPEGERNWKYWWLHAQPGVSLFPDDVVQYNGTQFRVKGKNDNTLYGYVEYELVEDFTGSGPQ